MTKVSIVMPVHNTPFEYLDNCLKSVFSQTFEEYELICVNDCSDSMETISCLNNFKNRIFKEKMYIIQMDKPVGAAMARNYGFEKATGEYVIFLDSDDVFRRDMLSIMYENAKRKSADICICNYRIKYTNDHYSYVDNYELNKEQEDWICRIPMNPWTKLIRRKYLIDNDIRFQSLTSCNDVYFSIITLLCSDELVYLNDKYLVDYSVDTPGNISSLRNPLNIWSAFEKVRNEIKKRFDNYDFHILDVTLLNACICELNSSAQEENKQKLYEKCKFYFKERTMHRKYWEIQRKCFAELEYETKWFEYIGDYTAQLRYNRKRILEKVGSNELWLCGIGKRGSAFLQFAHENNIKIQGACDKQDDRCGEVTYGVRIFSREELKKKENITVVASNDEVFLELFNEYKKNILINLQKFCPL